jgi:WD40 repeat protein
MEFLKTLHGAAMRTPPYIILPVFLLLISSCSGPSTLSAPTASQATLQPLTQIPPAELPVGPKDPAVSNPADFCRSASPQAEPSGSKPDLPVWAYLQAAPDTWQTFPVPFIQAESPSEIHSVACISQKALQTGEYDTGEAALTPVWTVRLFSWPGRELLAATQLEGGAPPASTVGMGIGASPEDAAVRWLWDQYQPGRDVLVNPASVWDLAVTPDGRWVAANAKDMLDVGPSPFESVLVWDAAAGKIVYQEDYSQAFSLDISSDGKLLAIGNKYGQVRIIDLATQQEKVTLGEESHTPELIQFSADSSQLAAVYNPIIKIWDVKNSSTIFTFHIDTESTVERFHFAISPDGKLLAGAQYSDVFLWNMENGKEIMQISIPGPNYLQKLIFSSDSRFLIAAGLAGASDLYANASIIPLDGSQPVSILLSESDGVGALARFLEKPAIDSIALSHNGQILAVGSGNGSVVLYDITTGQVIKNLLGHTNLVTDLAFIANDTRLVTADADGFVKLWQIK